MKVVFKIAANIERHGTSAMRTFRFDRYRQVFVAQVPLHEGRRKSVHRSGGIEFLA